MQLASLQCFPLISSLKRFTSFYIFSPSAEHREITLRHVSEPYHQTLPGPAGSVSGRRGGPELGLTGFGCPEETHLWHHKRPRGHSSHLQEIQEQHSVAVSVSRLTHTQTLFSWCFRIRMSISTHRILKHQVNRLYLPFLMPHPLTVVDRYILYSFTGTGRLTGHTPFIVIYQCTTHASFTVINRKISHTHLFTDAKTTHPNSDTTHSPLIVIDRCTGHTSCTGTHPFIVLTDT